MTKIIAYTALHYGAEYLAWAIRSVIDHIDEYWVLYSAVGSHGHQTTLPCPDSRAQLLAIAQQAAGNKLHWVDGAWPHEGAQRDSIHRYAPNADVIVVLDADEIWPEGICYSFRDMAMGSHYRRWRLPMIHFWRALNRAILDDPAYPERIICPHAETTEAQTISTSKPICHMGYAQSRRIVYYKQFTHGHKAEWRTDIDWFQERFVANAQRDCHPVVINYWNPVKVDPLDYLSPWMATHPYFGLEVIL